MLNNNVFIGNKRKIKKILTIVVVLNILMCFCIGIIYRNEVQAVQTKENVSSKLNSYPGYSKLINELRKEHPNWNFTIFYTGLDWNQVIKNETTAWHGRNLITSTKTGDWICPTCNNKKYDNGSWRCASEATVSYYMDPRNFLNDEYIFQFENLSYNGEIQTKKGVEQIIKDIGYMQGDTIKYTDVDGDIVEIEKSYSQVIMESAKEAGISPYHLASRIRQEQGTGKTASATANGTYTGYIGYYNFLNINASGSSASAIIRRALEYAKKNELDDPEKSIKAGAKFLAKSYIGIGQSTLYLQKFDVDNTDGSLYYHQYMQNVQAAVNEGVSVKKSYESMGMLNSSINFIIPVYENMPQDICQVPGTQAIVTQNVEIKGSNINIRSAKNTDSEIIATLNNGDKALRIEIGNVKENGYNWDKIVLPDGKKGYIVNTYLQLIKDVTNCNDSVIANTSVNLRNGPGTSGTSIITTLTQGQALTRIETGMYNGLDGYNWDRVKLSDGRQGYLVSSYIEKAGTVNESNNNTNTNKSELVKVICGSGLKVRECPGVNEKVLTYLDNGDIITRIEKNSSNVNGYIWDKIVTGTGVTGYIARGDNNEQYIEVIAGNSIGSGNVDTSKNNDFKVDTNKKQVVTEPNTTVEAIKLNYKNAIIKKDGKIISDKELVGTGYTVTIDGNTYTVVKKGDPSGDSTIDSSDLLKLQKYLLGSNKLTGIYKDAADTNSDGVIDSADLLKIQKYLLNGSNIPVQ